MEADSPLLIERIQCSNAVLRGRLWKSSGSPAERSEEPMDVQCAFSNSDQMALRMDGAFRVRDGQRSWSFLIEVPAPTMCAGMGRATVRSSGIAPLAGTLLSTRDALEILVSGYDGTLGSLHLRLDPKSDIAVAGMLATRHWSIAFRAHEGADRQKESAAANAPPRKAPAEVVVDPVVDEERETIGHTLDALDESEPRTAQVARLRYLNGYRDTEIAFRLGITEYQVRRDLAKARFVLDATLKARPFVFPIGREAADPEGNAA